MSGTRRDVLSIFKLLDYLSITEQPRGKGLFGAVLTEQITISAFHVMTRTGIGSRQGFDRFSFSATGLLPSLTNSSRSIIGPVTLRLITIPPLSWVPIPPRPWRSQLFPPIVCFIRTKRQRSELKNQRNVLEPLIGTLNSPGCCYVATY